MQQICRFAPEKKNNIIGLICVANDLGVGKVRIASVTAVTALHYADCLRNS